MAVCLSSISLPAVSFAPALSGGGALATPAGAMTSTALDSVVLSSSASSPAPLSRLACGPAQNRPTNWERVGTAFHGAVTCGGPGVGLIGIIGGAACLTVSNQDDMSRPLLGYALSMVGQITGLSATVAPAHLVLPLSIGGFALAAAAGAYAGYHCTYRD